MANITLNFTWTKDENEHDMLIASFDLGDEFNHSKVAYNGLKGLKAFP